ncbi:MAG: hypothetical protein ACFFDN_47690 [Candidatus Hodarchaeota archaeon]
MSEDNNYVTIRRFFEPFLDNNECRVLRLALYGQQWASNPKTKKPARLTIALPPEIVDTNLKALDDWAINLIAIPRRLIEELKEKEEVG